MVLRTAGGVEKPGFDRAVGRAQDHGLVLRGVDGSMGRWAELADPGAGVHVDVLEAS